MNSKRNRTALDVAWPVEFSPEEWPEGTLHQMSPTVLEEGLFPLRHATGIPMWPSAFATAHVRDAGNSRHSTNGGARLSDATDMHVATLDRLAVVFMAALMMRRIGGIGLYFDTNTPMFHIDMRPERLVWIRVDGEMIYFRNDPRRFFVELGRALESKA